MVIQLQSNAPIGNFEPVGAHPTHLPSCIFVWGVLGAYARHPKKYHRQGGQLYLPLLTPLIQKTSCILFIIIQIFLSDDAANCIADISPRTTSDSHGNIFGWIRVAAKIKLPPKMARPLREGRGVKAGPFRKKN